MNKIGVWRNYSIGVCHIVMTGRTDRNFIGNTHGIIFAMQDYSFAIVSAPLVIGICFHLIR